MTERVVVSISLSWEEAQELKRAMIAAKKTNRSEFIRENVISRLHETRPDKSDEILEELRSISYRISQGGFQVGQYQPMAIGSYIPEDLKEDLDNMKDFFSFVTSGDE